MKINVDFNALFILGSKAPLFSNNSDASIYVCITDGTTSIAKESGNTFSFPITLLSKTYSVLFSKTASEGYYEIAAGEDAYVSTVATNKMVAFVGLEDSVFEKEICNNVNTRTVGDQLTGGLTLIAASLGLVSVVGDVASAKVTVDHIDDSIVAAIGVVAGDEAAEKVSEVIKPKPTVRG